MTTSKDNSSTHIGLASWLGGGSTFIALLAVTSIAIACAVLIHHMVHQQALVRAQLAVTSARELLRRAGEDALSNAHMLAERPPLQRLLAGDDVAGLEPFLRRYADSTGTQVALLRGDVPLAQSAPADWPEIATAIREQGERFILAPRAGGPPIWGASVPVPGTDVRAVTLVAATPPVLQKIGEQVGASLDVVNFLTYHAPPSDELTPLHSAALANLGHAASLPLKASHAYGASTVLAAQTGEAVALLDARLSDVEFNAQTRSFNWVLAVTAIVVALIAGVLGTLYGRWLAHPVVALRDTAERFGRGDFTASIPPVAPLEVAGLARSMDEMRRNLIELTDTLRQREAEAQTVLSGVVEGVFAVDAQRRIRYANPQVGKLLGRQQQDIVGKFCGDVLQPKPVDGVRPCEQQCPIVAARLARPERGEKAPTGAAAGSAHELLCLHDGSTRSTIVISAPPVQGVQVQILRDETDLESARRARDSVLGNISHEFRTPLAAQLASIELLRDGLSQMPVDTQRDLLGNVERGVLRLMRLIDNLLESVRIEAGQRSIRQQSVDMSGVIVGAHELVAPLLRQRGLALQVHEPSVAAVVHGDAQRLEQVLVNLLANAAKFAPEHSTIRIAGRPLASAGGGPPQHEFWVEDEGAGVASTDSQQIFERFERGSEEPDAPGLGLGLWIVRSIIDRHGGEVRVERIDNRTRFTFSVPLADSAAPVPLAKRTTGGSS